MKLNSKRIFSIPKEWIKFKGVWDISFKAVRSRRQRINTDTEKPETALSLPALTVRELDIQGWKDTQHQCILYSAAKKELKKIWRAELLQASFSNKNPIRLEMNDIWRGHWKFQNSSSLLVQPGFQQLFPPGDPIHKKLHLTVKAGRWLWCSSQWLSCPCSTEAHWLKG